MKRLFPALTCGLFLTFLCGLAQAQTEKGNWFLGGSGSFQHASVTGGKISSIDLSPKAGIFVINNFAVGLVPSIGFTYDSYNDANFTDTKSYTLAIGPFLRYYYSISPVFKLFAEGSYVYGWSIKRPKPSFTDYNTDKWSIGPGAAFFITPSVSLDAAVTYGQLTAKGDVKQTTKMTEVRLGFSIYLK